MSNTAIASRTIKVIAKNINVPQSEVTPDKHILRDLGADRLDRVELALALEEEFGIDIPHDEVDKMHTVQDAIDVVTRHRPH